MLNRFLQRIADIGYHARYLRDAAQQYRLLTANGMHASAHSRRQAFAYARDVLGGWYFAPWLINYSAVRGSFVAGWIPNNYYGGVVVPQINRPLDVAGAKTFSARVLPAGALPDIGYLIDGRFYTADYARITAQQAAEVLFAEQPLIVAKAEYGRSGEQVTLLNKDDWHPDAFRGGRQRIVFQRYLQQHPVFDPYCRGGATVRMTTVREGDGSFRVRAAYARLSAPGAATVRANVAFRVALHSADGSAAQDARHAGWQRFTHHPDSDARFRDLAIPAYAAAVNLVCDLHRAVPQFGCVGWDLLIDSNERPWLLEWNTRHNGIAFSEASNGPHFHGLNWEQFRPTRRSSVSPPLN